MIKRKKRKIVIYIVEVIAILLAFTACQSIGKEKQTTEIVEENVSTEYISTDAPQTQKIERQLQDQYGFEHVNLGNMPESMAEEVKKACDFGFREYPELKGYLTDLEVSEEFGETDGVVAKYDTESIVNEGESIYPIRNKNKILLSSAFFSNPEKLENTVKKGARLGTWPKDSTVTSVVAHEFGHVILDYLSARANGLETTVLISEEEGDAYSAYIMDSASKEQKMEKKICLTAWKTYNKEKDMDISYEEFAGMISEYAKGEKEGLISYGETASEAFADYYLHGENMTEASRYIMDELEEMRKKVQ